MEVASLVFSVAQTLLASLQSSDLRDLFSRFGYKSELERLEETVTSIKAVLIDAEAKQLLSNQEQDFVEKLRSAVYDADDLFDEFATVAQLEKERLLREDGRVSKKVRRLFSRFKKLFDAYKMSREVKAIRRRLDGIANDAAKFGFKVDYQPIRQRREETCSYVYPHDIIGRDDDKKTIVDMLLHHPHSKGDGLFVVGIVGMGGLGKTALAQLVFNDERVKKEFPLRFWTCVADQDQNNNLDVKSILAKILELASGKNYGGDSSTELVQSRLQTYLIGKKYLLILDDVWTESRGEWLKLVNFLKEGLTGSTIVVTTRSLVTATTAVGSDFFYELKPLSDEDSWHLFEMTAGHEQANSNELVDIGRAIVKKCVNVPLAIKVVGTLLHGQDKTKWKTFQQGRLTDVGKEKNDIKPVLKFSYQHLSPSLKSCFTYCALFPKDSRIKKKELISLWIAQGYIKPLDEGQSIEDAAEEHFLILLRRCFFQDVCKYEYAGISSCKIHDLMHDIAQGVAGKEICIANSAMMSLDKNTRHISEVSGNCTESFFSNTKLRTWLPNCYLNLADVRQFRLDAMLEKLRHLRALRLNNLKRESLPLPSVIGELIHLRYLDLSFNIWLKALPKSITKLHNLHTLNLSECSNLEALPNDMNKLVKLRDLDIEGSNSLTSMPAGMDKLTCLRRLSTYIVAGSDRSSLHQRIGGLEDLRALRNLGGRIEIHFNKDYSYVEDQKGREVGYLSDKEFLVDISIEWKYKFKERGREDEDEALLEVLQPHGNLRVLSLDGYGGVRMPRWARSKDNLQGIILPNLVKVSLLNCNWLQEDLRWLGKLVSLKYLCLSGLMSLEYIETRSSRSGCGSPFFPALEELLLVNLIELRGWWRGCGSSFNDNLLILTWFRRLSKLYILNCPKLTSMPPCPTVEELHLRGFNERLGIMIRDDEKDEGEGTGTSTNPSSSLLSSQPLSSDPRLRIITISNLQYLKCLPHGALRSLKEMHICWDENTENLSEAEDVFRICSSSLQFLKIEYCWKLRSVSGGVLGHLSALESLELVCLYGLSFTDDEEDKGDNNDDEDDMGCRSVCQSLRTLQFNYLPKLESLPKWMQHLTSLQSLSIEHCPLQSLAEWIGCLSSLNFLRLDSCKLVSLPQAMRELTSLTRLRLISCPDVLKERCKSPYGEDWPNIRHIPSIQFEE